MSDDELDEELAGEQADSAGAGTLYIMREMDFLSGATFDYYKIGIVRGVKDVADREKQHRTGNPRNVVSVFELTSAAVQRLETRLHNHFAVHRVSSGEWFFLPGELLSTAIDRATSLNTSIEYSLPIEQTARELQTAQKSEHFTDPTQEALLIAHEYATQRAISDELSNANKEIAARIKVLAKTDQSIDAMLKTSSRRASNNFSASVLSKKYKALYEEFKTLTRESTSINFIYSSDALDIEFLEIRNTYGVDGIDQLNAYDLHDQYLANWSKLDQVKWDMTLLQAQLVNLAGTSAGITGVFEWQTKTKTEFDKAAFKEAHPDIYEECKVEKAATTTVAIAEWKSYSIR